MSSPSMQARAGHAAGLRLRYSSGTDEMACRRPNGDGSFRSWNLTQMIRAQVKQGISIHGTKSVTPERRRSYRSQYSGGTVQPRTHQQGSDERASRRVG